MREIVVAGGCFWGVEAYIKIYYQNILYIIKTFMMKF